MVVLIYTFVHIKCGSSDSCCTGTQLVTQVPGVLFLSSNPVPMFSQVYLVPFVLLILKTLQNMFILLVVAMLKCKGTLGR